MEFPLLVNGVITYQSVLDLQDRDLYELNQMLNPFRNVDDKL